MFEVNNIVQAGGLLGIALIIFAESALLLGLFLPGDTLLIAGGIFASEKKLPLAPLIVIAAVSTLAGYQVSYYLGRKAGKRIFTRGEGVLFKKDYMLKTESFFVRHGWKAILISRFIAVVRTVMPLIAGIAKMDRSLFLIFNLLGGIIWSAGIILLSYWVGSRVPNLDSYIKYFLLLAILLTFGSVIFELLKHKDRRQEIFAVIKDEYKYLLRRK